MYGNQSGKQLTRIQTSGANPEILPVPFIFRRHPLFTFHSAGGVFVATSTVHDVR